MMQRNIKGYNYLMKPFMAIIALIVFSCSGECAGKHKTAPKKTIKTAKAKATKSKKPVKWVGPPFGLYEVKVFNKEWVQNGEDGYSMNYFQWRHSFKWLRLYKNGTYKTNLSKTGKSEGRFSYNPTKQEVTFYVFRPKENAQEHLIYHKQPTDYSYDGFVSQTSGPIISWHHDHYTAAAHGGGEVECKWVKP